MQREGYIKGFKKLEIANNKNEFRIELKYVDGQPVIKSISRVSKPGRRVYSNIKDLQRNFDGLGIIFYRLLKAFFQTVKLELKVWEEKFYAKFSRRFF